MRVDMPIKIAKNWRIRLDYPSSWSTLTYHMLIQYLIIFYSYSTAIRYLQHIRTINWNLYIYRYSISYSISISHDYSITKLIQQKAHGNPRFVLRDQWCAAGQSRGKRGRLTERSGVWAKPCQCYAPSREIHIIWYIVVYIYIHT